MALAIFDDEERITTPMQPLKLPGGHRAPQGTYREVHSGHLVHIGHGGVLPGSQNSDSYVPIGNEPVLQLPRIRSEQA